MEATGLEDGYFLIGNLRGQLIGNYLGVILWDVPPSQGLCPQAGYDPMTQDAGCQEAPHILGICRAMVSLELGMTRLQLLGRRESRSVSV